MGQRLNVEIWNNGKALANAYYHWSAYTGSSAEITNTALNYINSNPIQDDNYLLYAIRILEATGAGLTKDEVEYAKKISALDGATFAECNCRIEGLLAISKDGIQETRNWQEGTVFIFLDEKRISFRVFFTEKSWEWVKEQREYYGNQEASARDLDVVSFNFDDIKFDEWQIHYDFLVSRKDDPFVCELEKSDVITPIY